MSEWTVILKAADWTVKRRLAYLDWARQGVTGLRGCMAREVCDHTARAEASLKLSSIADRN
jgi:hypothetical protein